MTKPKPDNATINDYIRSKRTIPAYDVPASNAQFNADIRRVAGRPVEEPKTEEEPTTNE